MTIHACPLCSQATADPAWCFVCEINASVFAWAFGQDGGCRARTWWWCVIREMEQVPPS